MRAVMYHYVRERDVNYPNFRFLDIKNFRKQLEFFADEFGFVSLEEWENCVKNRKLSAAKGKVLLTFDDAMSCHYEYVFPELLERRLWGVFYVPTKPYLENVILDVHKIHLLCGAFDGVQLLTVANDIVTEEMIPFKKRDEFRNSTYTRQNNYQGVSEFKRLLNYFIDENFRTSVIDQIASHFTFDFEASSFYVSKEHLKVMHSDGMVIGSHTYSHPVMSKLGREHQAKELTLSFDFLSSLGVAKYKTYCHPYGGFHSFNRDTVDLLEKLNVQYSFNVESRQIQEEDLKRRRQFLPRFDCNEFPYGKAS